VEEAQGLLNDHLVKAHAMLASQYAKPFRAQLEPWAAKLERLQSILDEWLKVLILVVWS
jgi:Dynein heavy chain, N-terminal region 2